MCETTAILKGEPYAAYDEYGNEIVKYDKTIVYAKPRSVYANEFYAAAQLGLHPSIVLELGNRIDYSGQKIVEYEGKDYEVIRTDWRNGREGISLTLTERIGND